jgi:hypothetical protein
MQNITVHALNGSISLLWTKYLHVLFKESTSNYVAQNYEQMGRTEVQQDGKKGRNWQVAEDLLYIEQQPQKHFIQVHKTLGGILIPLLSNYSKITKEINWIT